jgi:hypothetical protein
MPSSAIRVERWTDLDEVRDGWLKAGLVAGLPGLRMAELFRRRPRIFHEYEYLVVAVAAGDRVPLAVLAARWQHTSEGLRFLHIGAQFVVDAARGSDVFRQSWRELLAAVCDSGQFPTVSVLKTFNPIAYCAMRAYGRLPGTAMYPDVARPDVDPVLAGMAHEIAQQLAPDHSFDALTGVIRGVGVPADLYRERPSCEDADVNAYFLRHLLPSDRLLTFVLVRTSGTTREIQHRFEPATTN